MQNIFINTHGLIINKEKSIDNIIMVINDYNHYNNLILLSDNTDMISNYNYETVTIKPSSDFFKTKVEEYKKNKNNKTLVIVDILCIDDYHDEYIRDIIYNGCFYNINIVFVQPNTNSFLTPDIRGQIDYTFVFIDNDPNSFDNCIKYLENAYLGKINNLNDISIIINIKNKLAYSSKLIIFHENKNNTIAIL
ncbi:hypothetical protein Hokovirus_1_51 [Hokovirus HKV1]|uniref:Uncharacterized protein n=1 Tax=Hokovirus HKV1 TaxID=1977638 RepID=A0A1V0SEN2_9VIRU|nr:hypothetical protein Hokovirus_1_51 [Hokovirus HKV1]